MGVVIVGVIVGLSVSDGIVKRVIELAVLDIGTGTCVRHENLPRSALMMRQYRRGF